jgi:hypothetical protein
MEDWHVHHIDFFIPHLSVLAYATLKLDDLRQKQTPHCMVAIYLDNLLL